MTVTKPARKLERGEVFQTASGTLGWTYKSTLSGRSLFDKPILVAYWQVDDEFNFILGPDGNEVDPIRQRINQQLFDHDDTVVVVGFKEAS